MTQYATLRTWAALLTGLGVIGFVLAAVGTVIWAIEVDGTWETVARLLIGGTVAVFVPVLAIAVAQALRGLADLGETVAAR